MKDNKLFLGIIIGLISYFFYTMMDVIVKFVRTYKELPFPVFYFYINIITSIFLLIVGYCVHRKAFFKVKSKSFVILRATLSLTNFGLAFIAVVLIQLDVYYSIIFTTPMMAFLLAMLFLKEKSTISKIIALFGGFIGVLILTNPFGANLESKDILPILLALAVALGTAGSMIVVRKYLQNEKPLSVTFYTFILSSVASILLLLYTRTPLILIDIEIIFLLIITAICISMGSMCFVKAYQMAPVQIISPLEYSQMLWGIIFGYLLFHHIPSVSTLIGSAIIIASSSYIVLSKRT